MVGRAAHGVVVCAVYRRGAARTCAADRFDGVKGVTLIVPAPVEPALDVSALARINRVKMGAYRAVGEYPVEAADRSSVNGSGSLGQPNVECLAGSRPA